MKPRLRFFVLIVAVLLGTARAQAQTTISGRVLDAAGKPVANIEVLLHAITESSGSQVDKDTSGADGGFELKVDKVDAKSIYFVAVTQNGQLYMGELLRPPFPIGQEYIVRVGVNPVDLRGGVESSAPVAAPPQQDNSRIAGTVVIVVAIVVIGSVIVVALRRRPPERRRLLVELARLEEELSSSSNPSAALEKRRVELRNQLMDVESS